MSEVESIEYLVLGDLHLFAKRSNGEAEWIKLSDLLSSSESPNRCVLLGDIFDFSWARHGPPAQIIAEACDKVCTLVRSFPEITFEYILGNHDAHKEFVQLLHEHSTKLANLNIHTAHFQAGDVLFLHGDAADKANLLPDTLMVHRAKWAERKAHSEWQEKLYTLAVQLRIDEIGGLIKFFPPLIKHRLAKYALNCNLIGIRHIVFGHTHRRLESELSGKYIFSNAGAPIGYRRFEPLVITARI